MTENISRPVVGDVYLARKHRGGDPRSRYQPAMVTNGIHDIDGVPHVTVRWLFTDTSETMVFWDGALKALTRRWLTADLKEAEVALDVAVRRVLSIRQLLSDPEFP